jgi:uncharacterized protein YcfJ
MSSVCSVLIHQPEAKLFSKLRKMVSNPIQKETAMTTYLKVITAAILVVFTFPVWAGHDGDRYLGSDYEASQLEYARVVDVRPVIDSVQIPEQRRVCRERPVQRRVAEYRSPGPAIFGAILGGVIGNQLARGGHGHGHHSDRAAATAAGAVIGGAIAGNAQYRKYPARYYTENTQICNVETSWRSEERVTAWDVSWKYRGRIHQSRMAEPPGDRIPVRVSVVPVYP